MLGTRVIPCLLLRNHGLVKTVRFGSPTYVGDPINIVKIFNDKEIDELILLDITATVERREPDLAFLSPIAAECFVPFAYGGGIRHLEGVRNLLNLGFEKVIINSHAAEDPSFVRHAADRFGSQSIVVSIDVKESQSSAGLPYEVVTRSGTHRTGLEPVAFGQLMEEMGAGELLVNSVDRDGTMEGYGLELLSRITKMVHIPVIACGGAGSTSDLASAVHTAGCSAVAAGSFFVFQGRHRAVLITFPSESELTTVFPNRNLD